MFDKNDFKAYRTAFGFSNQADMKRFLAGKDILPSVNYDYVQDLNNRLSEMLIKISKILPNYDSEKLRDFLNINLYGVHNQVIENALLPLMNNQGRRPEQVYFSWMRGHLICQFFKPYIAKLFQIHEQDIQDIGDDDFTSIQTFKRTAKADLRFIKDTQVYHLEIQSGFQGINDVKQHKVLEAKRLYKENCSKTVLIHFDIFNGQIALIPLHDIADNDVNWITRQQMEGQTVFNVAQSYFCNMIHNDIIPIDNLDTYFND